MEFLSRPDDGVKAKNESFLKVLIWKAIGDLNPFSGIYQNRFIPIFGRGKMTNNKECGCISFGKDEKDR